MVEKRRPASNNNRFIPNSSHAAGRVDLVLPLARAAVAVGADGIIVETHPDPVNASSDAAQQIPSGKFAEFMAGLKPVIDAMKKK